MGGRKLKANGEESQTNQQNNEDVVQSSSSSSSFSSVVELTEKIESRDKAFSIDLIWIKLGQRLNYNDLKALRLVSTQFNNAILHQTYFINKSVVNLVVDGRLSPKHFGSTTVLWKHFKIGQSALSWNKIKKNNLDWFYPLLECAQSIEVLPLTRSKALNSPPLSLLLAAPTPQTLKKLVVQTNVLGCANTVKSLQQLSTLAKNNLKSLQEFHVTSVLPKQENGLNFYDLDWWVMESVDLLIPHLNNLMVIRIENTDKYYKVRKMKNLEEDVGTEIPRCMFFLIENNEKSLVELHVSDIGFWLNEELQYPFDMVFPRLKSLSMKASLHGTQDKNIIYFLDNQPELEELNITILHQFPIEVLEIIAEKSKKLKRLHIKTKGFDEEKIGMWNFIKDLNTLEDFGMEFIKTTRFRQNAGSTKTLMSCFPRSIKKLCLKGFACDDGILDRNSLNATDFKRLDGKQLTHLTLKSMSNGFAVKDETMKFICKNFTMLQHLDISGSGDQINDYGFTTGKMKLRSTNFSLQDLKGLRSLIFDSKKVTNRTFLHAIKFQELEHLQISVKNVDSRIVESEMIPCILKSNPSLCTFSMLGESITIPKMNEMRKWNERIQTVEAIEKRDDKDEDESEHEEDRVINLINGGFDDDDWEI